MMNQAKITSLFQSCLDQESSKEIIQQNFSEFQELTLHPLEGQTDEFLFFINQFYPNNIPNLCLHWSSSFANETENGSLFSSLCNYIKNILCTCQNYPVLHSSLQIFDNLLQVDKKAYILKAALSSFISINTVFVQYVWQSYHNDPFFKDKSIDNLKEFNAQLDSIQTRLISFVQFPENDGIRNLAIKFVHSLILLYSSPMQNETILKDNIEMCGLLKFPSSHPFLLISELETLGLKYLDSLLWSVCRSDILSSTNITAMINLLSSLFKSRPQLISHALPGLLDFIDNPPKQYTENQIKSIFHSLKMQLNTLLKLPNSSPFVPMITQLLNELSVKSKVKPKEKLTNIPLEDKLVTGETLTSQAQDITQDQSFSEDYLDMERKNRKRSMILAQQRPLPFEISKLSNKWIIDIIIESLLSSSIAEIEESISMATGSFEQSNKIEKNKKNLQNDKVEAIEEDEQNVIIPKDILSHLETKTELNDKALISLSFTIFDQVLAQYQQISISNNVSNDLFVAWSVLISRLVTLLDFLSIQTEDLTMINESDGMEKSTKDSYLEKTIMFCSNNLPLESFVFTVLLYLYISWIKSEENNQSRLQYLNNHDYIVNLTMKEILSKMITENDMYKTLLSHFLLLTPLYSENVIVEQLMKYIFDVENAVEDQIQEIEPLINSILTAAKDLLLFRPIVRSRLLPLLMRTWIIPCSNIRQTSINICRKSLLLFSSPFFDSIKEFAIVSLNELYNLQVELESKTNTMEMKDDENNIESDQPMNDSNNTEVNLHDRISSVFDLYLVLCEEQPGLLLCLFPIYNALDGTLQKLIRNIIEPTVQNIYTKKESVLISDVFRHISDEDEGLFLRILAMVTKSSSLSSSLISCVKDIVDQKRLDARYLLPILHGLEKSDVVHYLPQFLDLLSGSSKENSLVKEILSRIMSPLIKGSLTPIEVLVQVHLLEQRIGLKKAMEATQICFSLPELFKQEVLAAVLQQLVDRNPIPVIFMRTTIQTLNLYRSLSGFINSILNRLVSKKIWTQPQLWEGFIKCCQLLQPTSLQIILQLPQQPLVELLEKHPEMKSSLKTYFQQQPPSLRQRLQNVMALLEAS